MLALKVLCVYPPFPLTYWGMDHALRLTGQKAMLPPLGLLTVAALLPPAWEVRLCDMNVRPLDDLELDWADVVFVSGMLIQRDALLDVTRRAHARRRRVVVGGPCATACPDVLAPHVDCVVVGEAEELMTGLCDTLGRGAPLPLRMAADRRPELDIVPVPRFDLLDLHAYNSLSVQWSRGCPFACEFCDITEVFGRHPRCKSAVQLCRELDAIHATGFRGPLFFVDDNLVGNQAAALRMLDALEPWMVARHFPFLLYTEASINLAASERLTRKLVAAGFQWVFVGIESPSEEALRASGKLQNLVDLDAAVEKLLRAGLEVMGGFIVGFDTDDAAALDRLRQWVLRSPIPLAMTGMLTALPGTRLERRLRAEGRLIEGAAGDNFVRPNFRPQTGELELLRGYRRLLEEIYRPREYFRRALRALELQPPAMPRSVAGWRGGLRTLAASLVGQGLRGSFRAEYWRFLGEVLRRAPSRLPRAVALAVMGEHLLRYTREDVLPRLDTAIQGEQRRLVLESQATGSVER